MKLKNYELPITVKKNMWLALHKLLIRLDKETEVSFINYGFENEKHPDLLKSDEINRYYIQLYDHVVNGVDLYNKDILEIGSGRGGGASYITRYYEPRSYTGLDISGQVTEFCNHYYSEYGLSFVKGDATNLSYDKGSFDTLISIESVKSNVNMRKFLAKAHKILRKKGFFLMADIFEKDEVESLRKHFSHEGFFIESEKNITSNVLSALNKDKKRRLDLIDKYVPGFMKKVFVQFTGIQGTERYQSFETGKSEYWNFVLKKK